MTWTLWDDWARADIEGYSFYPWYRKPINRFKKGEWK